MSGIFLSYASDDREAVERLARELRKSGFDVWLDEWELDVGDSIPEKIQRALHEADCVAVWLTRKAVQSGWVAQEWQAKFLQGVSSKTVVVLPLLAEECEIPIFLADKKCADFRHSFATGLAQLLRALRRRSSAAAEPEPLADASATVLENVKNFLRDLEDARIPFPTMASLKLMAAMRALPRSGKLIRLETLEPAVPIRSVFDHVLSVGHAADVLLPLVKPPISGRDLVELARVIAYHDLCEVVLGDIPQYTRLTHSKRRRARVSAEVRLSQLPNGVPERITNEFIAMFLQDAERYSLMQAQKIMAGTSEIRRYYYALDKLDPIVATWRYVRTLRRTPGFPIDAFLDRMRNFFENPKVADTIGKHVDDKRLEQLVRQLQTPALAKRYFREPDFLRTGRFAIPGDDLVALIEGRELEYVSPGTTRGKPAARGGSPPP